MNFAKFELIRLKLFLQLKFSHQPPKSHPMESEIMLITSQISIQIIYGANMTKNTVARLACRRVLHLTSGRRN